MVFTNGVKYNEWKGIYNHAISTCFLGIIWQEVNIGSGSIPASYTWSTGTLPGPMVFTKGVKYNESKGIFNHAISTCSLGIIDKKVDIGSDSIPASYTWSTGILPGPMVFTKGVKYNESKGIYNHAVSTCFLGIIWQEVNIDSGSIPASYIRPTGTLPGPMVFTNGVKYNESKGIYNHVMSTCFLGIIWQEVNIGSSSIQASYTWSTGTLLGPMVFTEGVKYNESKGIFNHAMSTCFLGIIGKRSTLVERVSRRHTHDRRVYYLDQWCSLKVSSTMSRRVSSTMLYQLVS